MSSLEMYPGNWGEFVESGAPPSEGIRILLLMSDVPLFSCLGAIAEINRSHRETVTISAICTDAITDPAARIGARKRMWKHYSEQQRARSYERTKSFCVGNNINFYSGSIKRPPFSVLLRQWKPDIVLSAFFGQLIPAEVIGVPRFGIYNLHPSDTVRGIRGVDPFTDTLKAGIRQPNGEFGEVVIHQVTERFDDGPVVLSTPGLPYHDRDGVIPDNPLLIGLKFSLYVYPILVYALLERVIETRSKCDHADVLLSQDVLRRMNSYRYGSTIGFATAGSLLREMQEIIAINIGPR